MPSLPVTLGIVVILGFVALGITQSLDLPGSTLAGAATVDQRQLNLCMNDCMRGCVIDLDDQDPCREICEPRCGAR